MASHCHKNTKADKTSVYVRTKPSQLNIGTVLVENEDGSRTRVRHGFFTESSRACYIAILIVTGFYQCPIYYSLFERGFIESALIL